MKTLTKELWMEVPARLGIISIHDDVEQLVAESGVAEGLVLVNAMHITASVFINDNEPGLHRPSPETPSPFPPVQNRSPFDVDRRKRREQRPVGGMVC